MIARNETIYVISEGSVYEGTFDIVACVRGPKSRDIRDLYNDFCEIFRVHRRDEFGVGTEALRCYRESQRASKERIRQLLSPELDISGDDSMAEYFVAWLIEKREFMRVNDLEFHCPD